MLILGIESSCDECSVAVVENGKKILSNVIATQIDLHKAFYGVVPEIASRLHTEWIYPVVEQSLKEAKVSIKDIQGIGVTNKPGLVGSLLVGLSFAKGLSWSLGIPYIGIDHIRAHLYAPHLEYEIAYPYIGLLVSGGHTVISQVNSFDDIEVLGTTIDDACGEAFDKVAKYYKMGYPGGVIIDKLSKSGDPKAFSFPKPNLHKGDHRYDVSYSGLKTAVVNQLHQFHNEGFEITNENIAASFQKTAIDLLMKRLKLAVEDRGINRVVAGGGVSANSYLREVLTHMHGVEAFYPSLELCTDNGAMIAAIAYHYLKDGIYSSLSTNASARVPSFRKKYP